MAVLYWNNIYLFKTEIKEAHKRKKIMKERFKQEESIASAMVIWINEILPNWEVM